MIILQINVCTPCAEEMYNGQLADFICWLDIKVGMCRLCFEREFFEVAS
jgi:hypothetical protein